MPKELEEKLKREARARGLTGERFDAYVYGTMYKMGWRPASRSRGGKAARHSK